FRACRGRCNRLRSASLRPPPAGSCSGSLTPRAGSAAKAGARRYVIRKGDVAGAGGAKKEADAAPVRGIRGAARSAAAADGLEGRGLEVVDEAGAVDIPHERRERSAAGRRAFHANTSHRGGWAITIEQAEEAHGGSKLQTGAALEAAGPLRTR